MSAKRSIKQDDGFQDRELAIPAEFSRLAEARRFADCVAAAVGFDEECRYQIKLAANEAVANAVEHGSSSPKDTVRVRAAREGSALALYVIDGGSFAGPVSAGEPLPERGRGMAFMHMLMDEVHIRPGADGTVIRLIKRLL